MIDSPHEATADERPEDDAPAEEKPAEETPSETAGDPDVGPSGAPGEGGYEGRDPETDMPRLPSRPDAEDD